MYSFDGQAGEQVVGEAESTATANDFALAFGDIYTADGKFVGDAEFGSVSDPGSNVADFVSTTRLPSTGSYRLVLEPTAASTTLTLWNLPTCPRNCGTRPRRTARPTGVVARRAPRRRVSEAVRSRARNPSRTTPATVPSIGGSSSSETSATTTSTP